MRRRQIAAAGDDRPQRLRREPARHTLLDHSLRSEGNAGALVHSLELGQLQ